MTHSRDEKAQPAPHKGMSVFLKAMLWTALPMFVVTGIGVALTRSTFGPVLSIAGVGTMLWVLAILVCIGFAVARKRQIALGILAGSAIGAVALGLTCFARVSRGW